MRRVWIVFIIPFILFGLHRNPAAAQSDQPAADVRINFGRFNFDPLTDNIPNTTRATAALNAQGQGLYLLQANSTLSDGEIASLANDVTLIQYIPHQAYLVWSSPSGISNANSRSGLVRWTGDYSAEMRLSQQLERRLGELSAEATSINLDAYLLDDGSLDQLSSDIAANGGTLNATMTRHIMNENMRMVIYQLTVPVAQVNELLNLPNLVHLDQTPVYELEDESSALIVADQFDNTNGPNSAVDYQRWLAQIGLDGSGATVSINDTGIDWDHPDLNNRVVSGTEYGGYAEAGEPGSDGTPDVNGDGRGGGGHGTHVAGIVAADGSSLTDDLEGFTYGVGVAPGASLHAQDAIAEDAGTASQTMFTNSVLNADLSNNSWGGAVGVGYTAGAANHDDWILDGDSNNNAAPATPFLAVFSAGNSGPNANTLTDPKDGKNHLVVGNGLSDRTNRTGTTGANSSALNNGSSRGPAVDGRIKPDLYAPGTNIISTVLTDRPVTGCNQLVALTVPSPIHSWCTGTSMAAPHVAGVAALFTQFWREYSDDFRATPEPALVKAAMIATTETQNGVPNGTVGWGRVNADRLLNPTVPILYYENPNLMNSTGENWRIKVTPRSIFEPLRVALVWSDAPGAAGANPALVNDLDLTLTDINTNAIWRGNVFGGNGLSSTGGALDRINNVENVWIQNPSAGGYEITVNAFALNGDGHYYNGDATDQHFSLVCYNCVEKLYVDDKDYMAGAWTFDENTGSTAYDMSGRNNHLSLQNGGFVAGGATMVSTNYAHYGWAGSSTGNAIDSTAPDVNISDEFSVSMLVKRNAGVSHINSTLFRHDDIELQWSGSSSRFLAEVRDAGDTNIFVQESAATADGTWVRVTMTWHKDGYLRLYENSNLLGEVESEGTAVALDSAENILIGSNLSGFIDNVLYYERALDATEIQRLVAGLLCETDGANWRTAFRFLQCALTRANAGWYPTLEEINVAEGTYSPGTNRGATFNLNAADLRLLGGFSGRPGDEIMPDAYPTVLTGDIGRDDTGAPTGHNSTQVMDISSSAFVAGFTVRNGLADSGSNVGGAAEVSADTTFVAMTFYNNFADAHAGALSIEDGSEVGIVASRFIGNVAGQSPSITGVGGGIQVWSGSLFMSGVELIGNRSEQGGAIHVQSAVTSLEIYNSTFANNDSGSAGGGAIGSFIAGTVENSIFYGNAGSNTAFGSLTINNSIFEGGWGGTGSGNLHDNPLFLDIDGVDNLIGTLDDNARLTSTSPAIDAGNDGTCNTQLVVIDDHIDGDGDGNAVCDIGARERGTLLVVDDDNNAPDVRPEMVNALVDANLTFEWWDTGDGVGSEPTATEMAAHSQVFWFTGAHSTTSDVVGPTSSAESGLQLWLDSGNRCFMLSSLDYIYSRGNTSFATNYLGLAGFTQDEDYTDLTGAGLMLGEDHTLWAGRLSDTQFGWNDLLTPAADASTLFTTPEGTVAITKQTSDYQTAFLGFSPASLIADRYLATDERGDVLKAFLDNCGPVTTPTAVGLDSVPHAAPLPSIALLVMIALLPLTGRLVWRRAL